MDKINSKQYKTIHLSEINEFLAEKYLKYKSTFELSLKDYTADGYVEGKDKISSSELKNDGVDFELSTCECHGLSETEISELVNTPVYTSSAYEFFDAYLPIYKEALCLVNMVDGSWLIKVVK